MLKNTDELENLLHSLLDEHEDLVDYETFDEKVNFYYQNRI